MNRSSPVVSVWSWGQVYAVNIPSRSHATFCNSVSAAPLQPTLIHEGVQVEGTTQKDTQDGVSHLCECGVASTSLHCVVMSVCTSLYEISLDEQTKYNPYPGIHSFVDHKHLPCSIRETLYSTFFLCSSTAVCNPGDIAKESTCGRGITPDKRCYLLSLWVKICLKISQVTSFVVLYYRSFKLGEH